MPEITALYTGVLGLFAVGLAAGPGLLRGKVGVGAGDGGNRDLELAMRRHANFVEHVPLTLLLIAGLEVSGVAGNTIHIMGAGLVVFRIFHAVGISHTVGGLARTIGAAGTTLITVVASIWLIVKFVL